MSIFSSIGHALFGGGSGGGGGGYKSPYTSQYDTGFYNAIGNRLGATPTTDKNGKTTYNYSQVGKSPTMQSATAPYDYSGVNQAMTAAKNPYQFNAQFTPTTYSPTTFSFGNQGTINKAAQDQYQLNAGDINRQGQDALTKVQQTVGTRNPGLLAKTAEDNQRNVQEQLTGLNTNLGINAMNQGLQYGQAQQTAQAGENQFGANFGANQAQQAYADLSGQQQNQADENYRENQSLASTDLQKINSQSGLTENAITDQDRALQYLYQALAGGAGWQQQAAQLGQNQQQMSYNNMMGTGAGVASIAGLFA